MPSARALLLMQLKLRGAGHAANHGGHKQHGALSQTLGLTSDAHATDWLPTSGSDGDFLHGPSQAHASLLELCRKVFVEPRTTE